jgi:hypothetical protein
MIFDFTGENEFSEDFPVAVGDLFLLYFFWDGDIKLSMIVVNVKDVCEDSKSTNEASKTTMFNVDTNEFVDMGYHGILRNVSYVIRK